MPFVSDQHIQAVGPAARLPAQLLQLELTGSGGYDATVAGSTWLALERLSALTSLHVHSACVGASVRLPSMLVELQLDGGADAAAPLLLLTQLTRLVLRPCRLPVHELRQLSALRCLAHLDLSMHAQFAAACAGLVGLPLTHLRVDGIMLTREWFGRLAHCTALLTLELEDVGVDKMVVAEMGESVACLTRLTRMQFVHEIYAEREAHSGPFFEPLVKALVGLPQLRSLWIGNTCLWPEEAACLAGATQLTWLRLDMCELHDEVVGVLCRGLTGLRELALVDNFDLTDASLVAIAGTQRWLTCLTLDRNGEDITDAAVEQLELLLPGASVLYEPVH